VPAGYVFSIWGVIYLALAAYAVYQALPSQRDDARLRDTGYPFALSCVANIAWIFLWHYEVFPLTLVAMFALLTCLIVIYLRLGIGHVQTSAATRWLVHVPFSIYLGWVTVATVANVTSVLDYVGWDGWGISPQAWAVIMLVIASTITFLTLRIRKDIAYALVIVWAFAGIGVKHADAPLVAAAAWVTCALVVERAIETLLFARKNIEA
jgi:hypothetical protein